MITKEHEYLEQDYFWGFILPTKYYIETAYHDIGCVVDGEILDPRFKLTVVTPDDKVPFYYNGACTCLFYSNTCCVSARSTDR